MRRLSVASLDSGAESPVYGEEPSASAERDPAEMPPRVGGIGRWAKWPTSACFRMVAGGNRTVTHRHFAAGATLGGPVGPRGLGSVVGPGGSTSLTDSQRMAARDTTENVDSAIPWQVGTGVPRVTTSCDMSVVDPQSGRWYVKDIRASNAADGNPMTWFASSWAVGRGSQSPGKLTDVHGREG